MYYTVIVLAIASAVLLILAYESDKKKIEAEEPNLFKELYRKIDLSVANIETSRDREVAIKELAIAMMDHGRMMYRDGFDMGQQIKLQEPLGMPAEVAEEIMKNQYKPII